MLKYYLLLIIVISIVQQRVCGPLNMDYNDAYEIDADSINPHAVAGMEGGYLKRSVRYIQRPRRNCKCRAFSNPCECNTTSTPLGSK
ncbi:hypothetical protein DOY81_008622 [Sarcophaga bullata]|nr:hypothetical protein DOY81_008622 [Sarcophaga bullata]